ncbi:MAG: hypothetical protein JNM56_30660, partial [Planctomycetia bacterium]|nr:hypothetical protein [Planctomycetia bacterium]
KPDLLPQAALSLEGGKVVRSELSEDPGFRLQYHVMKDGKSLAVVDARSAASLDLPAAPGTYIVTLELFYPGYKTGTVQKGNFKAVSNVLTCLAQADAAGQMRYTDVGTLRSVLFYGLAAGKQIPVPELPPPVK